MATVHAADDIRDLERGEHLVLFGFRLLALGHGDCPALRGTFCGLLGDDADEAICSLFAFVRVVGWIGRNRVRLHLPGCCRLSGDEQRILAVVSAAQASVFDTSDAALKAELHLLLGCPADEACLMAAQSLAATLACHGMTLPERYLAVRPDLAVARRGATLH